jgi:hypothetical protein
MTAQTALPVAVSFASLAGVQPLTQSPGDPAFLLAVVTVVAYLLSVVFAVYVTYQFVQSYRRTRNRSLGALAVGLLLLAPLPLFLQLLVGNLGGLTDAELTVVVTASRLAGLLVVLGVVYR